VRCSSPRQLLRMHCTPRLGPAQHMRENDGLAARASEGRLLAAAALAWRPACLSHTLRRWA
jgi:hypothetical protein